MTKPIWQALCICLVFLGLNTLSQGSDNETPTKNDQGLSYSTLSSIEAQKPAPLQSIRQIGKLDSSASEEILLEKKNYDIPEVTNYCGFLCGRCQFIYYYEDNPEHDCFGCGGIERALICCGFGNMFSNGGAGISVCVCPATLIDKTIIPCTLLNCAPIVVTSSLTGVCILHALTGGCFYCCAKDMGKTDFTNSFKRGMFCHSGDACSLTSCIGVSKTEINQNRYLCCASCCTSCKTNCDSCCDGLALCWIQSWTLCCGESQPRSKES